MISKFLSENKNALAFALAVMLLGSSVYFAYSYEKDIFVLMKGSEPKRFLHFEQGKYPFTPALSEGSWVDYKTVYEGGKKFCPLAIGTAEAGMMRKEGLFNKTGDRIYGFFGNDVFIAGVLSKTGGEFDMLHFVSEDCKYQG